jgi:WD40 repeat protein
MLRKVIFSLILFSYFFCPLSYAQDCMPPSVVANAKSTNLFSPEQEMILGDLVFQSMATKLRLIRDEKLSTYVDEIGERLTKHLPPTGLRFKFHLIDIPDLDAFNIAGGHVFITRKLIAFANNEDELAGMIAHELGHATARHSAVDFSDALRRILGVTAVTDRKDIVEKYNLLIERERTKRVSRKSGHENEEQLEADRIGMFAMVAAGYDPLAFFTFLDRVTESEGKTGSWFSELFGTTRPEQKRLREIIRATEQLPQACRDARSGKATDNFLKWQADVASFREVGRKEELPGLIWKKELAPKLRSDVSHFAFSQDGKFLLAQDDFSITLIERESLQVLFQIPIEKAREANFSSDGKYVIFTTEGLRYEKWSIADKKPAEVRELALTRDCWEHKLSPDGDYLACVDSSLAVNLLDTKTGKKIWYKQGFYRLTHKEFSYWRFSTAGEGKANLFRIEYSPDSHFVIFSRSNKFRHQFRVNGMTIGSEDTALALDLTSLKPANIGGDLRKVSARPYVFLDSGRILGMPTGKAEDAGIFSFPEGRRLRKFDFSAKEIKRTANPDYVIIKPLADAKIGVFDVKKGALVSGFNKKDATFWNNFMAYESTNGSVITREVSYNEAEKKFDGIDARTVEIPISSMINLDSAAVSDNFNWLLLSSQTRGGLWNLETGERKFYVRGFKGGIVANDGASVGEFPKLDETKHSLVLMNPRNNTLGVIHELPEKGARQYGRFVLLRRGLKQDANTGEEKKADAADNEESGGVDLSQGVRFELKDFIENKIIWSRDFPKQAPRFSFDKLSGRLIFYWELGSEAGKERLRESAELQTRAQALGNKSDDYLVEVVDAVAQRTVGLILLETGQGSFAVGGGLSAEDWLVLRDSEGRALIYSIKDGVLRHRFFGSNVVLNVKKNQIAIENFPGEIALYNLGSGDQEANLVINGNAAFLRFNPEGNKLFVLSATQTAYSFDLNGLASKKATQAR